MKHEFLDLPYEYDSLEPYIDKETMQVHHDKHHKAYFDKFIDAISEYPELNETPIEEILLEPELISEEVRQKVINNGGGFYNHAFFWTILKRNVPFDEDSEIGQAIIEEFGSFEDFKEQFSNSALTLFGSGWAWLVIDNDTNKLEIIQTKNQDSPLSINKTPLMGIDVWEHAYYLKYQNRRAEYIQNFFSVINWERINELFVEIME